MRGSTAKALTARRFFGVSALSFFCIALSMNAGEPLEKMLESAIVAERAEKFEEAGKIFRRATESFPESAAAWAAYGEHLRFYTPDAQAAVASFKKALSARDKDAQASAFAWRGLGEIAAKDGDTDEAIRLMKKSLEAQPLSDTHRSLCHLYVMQKDWKNAAEHARQAAELDPDDPIALLLYAAQLERSGEHKRGAEYARKAMELAGVKPGEKCANPVHCCVLYNLAGYYAVTKNSPRAMEMLEAFFKTPNHRHLSREDIENDPDFEPLRTSKEFAALMDKYFAAKNK